MTAAETAMQKDEEDDRISTKMMPFVYFKKKYRPQETASLSFSSHTVQYGTTVFDSLRGHFIDGNIHIFRLQDHFDRLMEACLILGFEFEMEYDEYKKIIEGLIVKNKPTQDVYFRPFIYCGDEVLAPRFDGLKMDLAIYMMPLGAYHKNEEGLKLMVSSWKKFSDASISTKAKAGGAYLNASLARSEAARNGCDEALMMDENWNIVEGSVENIGISYRGEFLVPQEGSAILGGITIRSVIEFLEDEGIKCRQTTISRSMIYTADELLLTGTAANVIFAGEVDGRKIGPKKRKGPGPLCELLTKKFEDCLHLKHPFSEKWMTVVKLK
jgi:branched-chain amino acid aminotransferase